MNTPDCLNSICRHLKVSYIVLRVLLIVDMGLIGSAILVATWHSWILPGALLLILVIIALDHLGSRLQCIAHLLNNPWSVFWMHAHMDNPNPGRNATNGKECWVMHFVDGRNLDVSLLPNEVGAVVNLLSGHNSNIQINEFKGLNQETSDVQDRGNHPQ